MRRWYEARAPALPTEGPSKSGRQHSVLWWMKEAFSLMFLVKATGNGGCCGSRSERPSLETARFRRAAEAAAAAPGLLTPPLLPLLLRRLLLLLPVDFSSSLWA